MTSPFRFGVTDPCAHIAAPLWRWAHTRSGATTHLRTHPSHKYTRFHTANTGHPCRKPQPTCTYMSVPTHVHTHAHSVNTPCTHIRAHTLHPHTIVRTYICTEMVKPSTHMRAHTRARTHVCFHTPTHTCKHTLYRHSIKATFRHVVKGRQICAEIFNTHDPTECSHTTARKNATKTNMHIHVCAHTPPHTYEHTHFNKRAHTSGRTRRCCHVH